MAVILALGSAVVFGVGDFLGGYASRRVAVWSVVVVSQACGLVAIVVLHPFLPTPTVSVGDVAWGAAAGLAGGLGLTQFFRSMTLGAMSVAAPIAAVVNALVPVSVGLATGDRPTAMAWLGIVVGVPAIGLISREGELGVPAPRAAVVAAFAAGIGFGCFSVFIDRTGNAAGVVPIIAARGTSVALLGAFGLWTRRVGRVPRSSLPVVLVAGLLDTAANVLLLYAVREGLLSLVAVVLAMYPASTILLARVVLDEHLHRIQLVGLGLAAGAVSLVALG